MRAPLPVDTFDRDELEKSLVHERGGLQRMVASFAAHQGRRAPTQLVVDDGEQRVEGCAVADACGVEQ
jgi:hypothetical protein